MKRCSHCGCQNDERHDRCGLCGEVLTAAPPQTHSQPDQERKTEPASTNALNEERSIWITEEQLGTVRTLKHRGRRVQYRVPNEVGSNVTLRFKGHGQSKANQTGDLLLHVRVDRGEDAEAALWLAILLAPVTSDGFHTNQ